MCDTYVRIFIGSDLLGNHIPPAKRLYLGLLQGVHKYKLRYKYMYKARCRVHKYKLRYKYMYKAKYRVHKYKLRYKYMYKAKYRVHKFKLRYQYMYKIHV